MISSGGFSPLDRNNESFAKEDDGDDDCHRLSFSVRTNEFADAFYKVRTNITSVVDQRSVSRFGMKISKEGKTKREIDVFLIMMPEKRAI